MNYKMSGNIIRNTVFNNLFKYRQCLPTTTHYSTKPLNLETLEKESVLSSDVIDEDLAEREAEIEQKRNKSRLDASHRNVLHNKAPYTEPMHWSHGTLRYHRVTYGRYGESAEINPSICWPTKDELAHTKEKERVVFPDSIQEMIETNLKVKAEKKAAAEKRQSDIIEKVKKLDGWMKDLNMRIAKKEKEVREAKERKDKLIEEVRRQLGYSVSPRDDRFKELLEKKEKEQKKQMKEARKKVKEEKMKEKILTKHDMAPIEEQVKEK